MPRDDRSFWGLKDPALALALVVAASTGAPAQQRYGAVQWGPAGQRLAQRQVGARDACERAACSFGPTKVPPAELWLLQATVDAAA